MATVLHLTGPVLVGADDVRAQAWVLGGRITYTRPTGDHEFAMVDDRVDPGALQRLLEQAEGKPEERMVNYALLRCMKQARYAAENLGHFGLAAVADQFFRALCLDARHRLCDAVGLRAASFCLSHVCP